MFLSGDIPLFAYRNVMNKEVLLNSFYQSFYQWGLISLIVPLYFFIMSLMRGELISYFPYALHEIVGKAMGFIVLKTLWNYGWSHYKKN